MQSPRTEDALGKTNRHPPQQKWQGRARRRSSQPFWLPIGILLGFAASARLVIGLEDPFKSVQTSITVHETFPMCDFAWPPNCVIDGHTIRYRGEDIQIEDISTPETREAECPAEKALGDRAARRMAQLINQGPFDIVYDGRRGKDRYGRKFRLLERNGKSLSIILVEEGLAYRWDGQRRSWCG